MAIRRFKSMKLALRSLNKKNAPKTLDEVRDFINTVDDEKFGLGVPPVTLADVMSYQDDPNMKDFDFFETYYNSPAAEYNRKRSEELFDEIYSLDDNEKELIDQIAFKTARQIANSLAPSLSETSAKAKLKDDEAKAKKLKDEKPKDEKLPDANIDKKSETAKKLKDS